MRKKLNFTKLIESYLDGELEGEELKWFRDEINSNPELSGELKLHQEIEHALNEKDIIDLREQLEGIHKTVVSETSKYSIKPIKRKRVSVAVASLAVVIIVSFFIYQLHNNTYSNEKLFIMYYEPYEGISTIRSGDPNTDKMLYQAMKKYESKNYENALILFEQVLAKDSLDLTTNFYTGISAMENRKYVEAKKPFNRIINHNDNLYIEQAEWYLALCYLITDNTLKARTQFKKIVDNNSFNNCKAKKILTEI